MKQPRLKNYFVAVPPDEYQQFEHSRVVAVRPAELDIITGKMSGRPYLYLCATPDIADNLVREQYRYGGAVYILRVPAACVDRSRLKLVSGATQIWQYDHSLTIPECAVYRYQTEQ